MVTGGTQNHKVDRDWFYRRKVISFDAFLKAHQQYANRYNNIAENIEFYISQAYITKYVLPTSVGVYVTHVDYYRVLLDFR